MKKLPIEERKISTTFGLTCEALKRLDEIQKNNYPGKSRSYVMDKIIETVFNAWIFDQERTEEFPDDVSEVGYNPFTGSYEEDL